MRLPAERKVEVRASGKAIEPLPNGDYPLNPEISHAERLWMNPPAGSLGQIGQVV